MVQTSTGASGRKSAGDEIDSWSTVGGRYDWKDFFELWEQRNECRHGKTKAEKALLERNHISRELEIIFRDANEIHEDDKAYFDDVTLEELLETPTANMYAWKAGYEKAIQASKKRRQQEEEAPEKERKKREKEAQKEQEKKERAAKRAQAKQEREAVQKLKKAAQDADRERKRLKKIEAQKRKK